MVADPVHERPVATAGWLLPVLLTAKRCQVEVVIRAGEQVRAARVGRVGVENAVAVPQEDTQAVRSPFRTSSDLSLSLYSTGATDSSNVTWKS